MTFDQIQRSLKQISLREMAALAQRAGVPYGTALKIRGGYTQNPRIRTVEALAAQFALNPHPDDGLPADRRAAIVQGAA